MLKFSRERPKTMPEFDEDFYNDHLRPRCKDENASVDGGHACLECGYVYGDCLECGRTSTNLTIWMSDNPFYEDKPNQIVPRPEERKSLERNVHDDDLTGYYFFGPPYFPVRISGEKIYVCESTQWSFKCEVCNTNYSIHCD